MSTETNNPFEPGKVFKLTDITQLHNFENLVALHIDPAMTANQVSAWQARPAARDLIRPSKFNGTIADMTLSAMAEPYARLVDARQRGWNVGIGGGRNAERTSDLNQESIKKYIGFTLLANATSSGRGVIGQIQTELWYYPVRLTTNQSKYAAKQTQTSGGRSINRLIAKPHLEKEKFVQLEHTSKTIALAQLRRAIINAKPHALRA